MDYDEIDLEQQAQDWAWEELREEAEREGYDSLTDYLEAYECRNNPEVYYGMASRLD